MKGKDEIKDFFSDKLGSFEAPVRPELWTNIASQIGATSPMAFTSLSLFTKSMIGIGIAGVVIVTTVLLVKPNSEEIQKEKVSSKTTVVDETNDNKLIKENNLSYKPEEILPNPNIENQNSVQQNSPVPNKIIELDQNQNFKTDISLISPLKEKVKTVSENKEEKSNTSSGVVNKTTTNSATENNKTVKENNSQKEISKEETIGLKQKEEMQKAYSLGELPNIFTPNGDGNNDFLFIESEGLVDFTIVVLDAKQKVMFESNDPNFKWNGIDKSGNTVSEGSYGYYIIARDKNGNKVNKFVTLEIRF